jgi:8-oxo-dGTP pyrophosphatase MutT (NUDIX family)
MKQLAYITQGSSTFEPRLRELLEATGIDPEEFIGLEYFSLTPFFVIAGATVRADAHTHGDDVHVSGVVVELPEELESAFYATLPPILDDAYGEPDDEGASPNGA